MNYRQNYQNYRNLRARFHAKTLIPKQWTQEAARITASMDAMDSTENYLAFMARADVEEKPSMEAWFERQKLSRDMAIVNSKAEAMWKKAKRRWTLRTALQEYFVLP